MEVSWGDGSVGFVYVGLVLDLEYGENIVWFGVEGDLKVGLVF